MESRLPILAAALLAACTTTSVQEFAQPDTSVPLQNPSRSRIYVMRAEQVLGSALPARIYEDRDLVGHIMEGSYVCWDGRPGRRLLSAVLERRPIDGGDIEGLMDLVTEGGGTYFVKVAFRNSDRKPELSLMGAEEGRALLARRKPADPKGT